MAGYGVPSELLLVEDDGNKVFLESVVNLLEGAKSGDAINVVVDSSARLSPEIDREILGGSHEPSCPFLLASIPLSSDTQNCDDGEVDGKYTDLQANKSPSLCTCPQGGSQSTALPPCLTILEHSSKLVWSHRLFLVDGTRGGRRTFASSAASWQ